MDDISKTVHDADVAVPEFSGAVHQPLRHERVRLEEVVDGVGVEGFDGLIRRVGSLDFVDFTLGTRHALAGEDGRDLFLGERVALDGGGAAEGADVVDLPEADAVRPFEDDPVAFHGGGDFGNQVHRLAAHRVGRGVGGHRLVPWRLWDCGIMGM